MSKPALVTKWFIVSTAVYVIVYAFWAANNDTPSDTISEVMLHYAVDHTNTRVHR